MRKVTNEELNRATVEEFALRQKLPIVVVADNIRSAQNVGSLFRTCDAFRISRLVLCGITPQPPSRDIHKSALGAEMSVEWSYHPTTIEAVEELRQQGYRLLSIEQVEGATMLHEALFEPTQKYAIIFGNEVMGVDQEVVDLCDGAIEIPQSGTKHSLNVSVAGGVVLWSAYQQLNFQ